MTPKPSKDEDRKNEVARAVTESNTSLESARFNSYHWNDQSCLVVVRPMPALQALVGVVRHCTLDGGG